MNHVNSQEVIAAQAAGQYANDHNERSNSNYVETIGSGMQMYTDIRGTHYRFPVNVNRVDSTRVGDIIIIMDFDQVIGCFLR